MGNLDPAVQVTDLSYSYRSRSGVRRALQSVSLSIGRGEIFGLLGPNGGGKTTLFRLLSTYFAAPPGAVQIFGQDASQAAQFVRRSIGVVFQSPSLDKKLTVLENLRAQGHLYGLRGAALMGRIDELLRRLGLEERKQESSGNLSGGLQRRVELAKGLIHGPELLILDEPSSGLDPGARKDFWSTLKELRANHKTTVVFTTHLIEEAERCDRLAILHQGQVVALGEPESLKSELGGEILSIVASEPRALKEKIRARFGCAPSLVDGTIRIEGVESRRMLSELAEEFGEWIQSATLSKPTLEDVFIHRTGHKFWRSEETE